MGDIQNPSGVQGAVAAAILAGQQAQAELTAELTNPANHGLERFTQQASRAIQLWGKAIELAAVYIDK